MAHSTRSRGLRTTHALAWPLAGLGLAGLALAGLGLAAPGAALAQGSVARVGKSEIPAREYEEMSRQLEAAHRAQYGRPLTEEERPGFERYVLEQLIRQRLLRAEAARLGIRATDEQAEAFLRQDPYFQTDGRFDAAKWAALQSNPEAYRRALRDARDLLSGRRLLEQVRRQSTPPDDQLRRLFDAWNGRALLNTVLVEKEWFEGGVEIAANHLRAFYDSLVRELPERAEVELELFLVPTPAGRAETARWEAAEARADSARRAVERGARFESVAAAFGGVRAAGAWKTGDSGGLFYEDEQLGEEALTRKTGSLLPRPLRVPGGWAVVRVRERRDVPAPPLDRVALRLIEEYRGSWLAARSRADLDSLRHAHPDSFRTTCATWHLAIADTAKVRVKNPSRKDLERWFEENPTLFARLDPEGRGVVTPAFEEVEPAVRATYLDAQRSQRSLEVATKIGAAWAQGKRDKKAEEEAVVRYAMHTTAAAPAQDLAPELAEMAFRAPVGEPGSASSNRGTAVFYVAVRDTACALPADPALAVAQRLLATAWTARKERAARALYDAEPGRFLSQPKYAYTYVVADVRAYEITDFEPGAIEAYYEAHKNEFGNPERVRVRHLLIATPPGADTLEARQKAERILALARAGAPFDSLVLEYSEEPLTRERGGDSGVLERNTSPPALRPLEDLAFSVRPGELGGPVRTPYGYHLVEGLEYWPAGHVDLISLRATIGGRLAQERAEAMTRQEVADAAARLRTREELVRWAESRDYQVRSLVWAPGTKPIGPAFVPEVRQELERRDGPGMLPGAHRLGVDFVCVHLDSVLPPGPASWEEAREQALTEVEGDLELRASLDAAVGTRSELEAGAEWSEAAAPWGGGIQRMEYSAGFEIEGIGPLAALDTLCFGSPGVALAPGGSAVVPTSDGAYLIQLSTRRLPTEAEFLVAREALRSEATERELYAYFEKLKQRYPVRILRSDLDHPLPPPPLSAGGAARPAGTP